MVGGGDCVLHGCLQATVDFTRYVSRDRFPGEESARCLGDTDLRRIDVNDGTNGDPQRLRDFSVYRIRFPLSLEFVVGDEAQDDHYHGDHGESDAKRGDADEREDSRRCGENGADREDEPSSGGGYAECYPR